MHAGKQEVLFVPPELLRMAFYSCIIFIKSGQKRYVQCSQHSPNKPKHGCVYIIRSEYEFRWAIRAYYVLCFPFELHNQLFAMHLSWIVSPSHSHCYCELKLGQRVSVIFVEVALWLLHFFRFLQNATLFHIASFVYMEDIKVHIMWMC